MLKADLYRVLKRKRLWLAFPIFCLILFAMLKGILLLDVDASLQDLGWFTQLGARDYWPPLHSSEGKLLYDYAIFVLVALPASDLFVEDKKNNLWKNYHNRVKRLQYSFSHYVACFLSSAIIGILPIILCIYLCFMLLPDLPLHPLIVPNYSPDSISHFNLLFDHFWLYLGYILLRGAFFCGFFGTVAMFIDNITNNAYAGYFLPLILWFLIGLLPFPGMSGTFAILPVSVYRIPLPILLLCGVLLLFVVWDGFQQSKQIRKR